jgi:curved DNA-binding protein CbpA
MTWVSPLQWPAGQTRTERPRLEVLGVPPLANREAIDRAYRQLVRTHHPDVGGDKVQFQENQAAYEEAIAS